MTHPLDRARALIELAAGEPNEEAARSAAVEACRIIKKHGFVVALAPPAPVGGREPAYAPPPARAPDPHVEALKQDLATGIGAAVGQFATGALGDLLSGKMKRRRR